MSNKQKDDPRKKVNKWLKADGKTVVEVNSFPASEAKAKELGWKKK